MKIMRINLLWLTIVILGSCHASQRKDIDSINSNSSNHKPQTDTVFIINDEFQPQDINVHEGDTLVWINKDPVSHRITELKSCAWTSGIIPSGASWKMAVSKAYDYYCY